MTESARYGKWEVVKSIGRGGQGKVYLVRDASGTPNTKDRLKTLRHAMAALVGVQEESQREFGLKFTDEIRRIAGESQRSDTVPSKQLLRASKRVPPKMKQPLSSGS